MSDKRQIKGLDFDDEKIAIAKNVHASDYANNNQVSFEVGDVCAYAFTSADVFILSDVLHYLPYEKQEQVLNNCVNHLNEGGKILIHCMDGKSHSVTILLSFLIYRVQGNFNKNIYH